MTLVRYMKDETALESDFMEYYHVLDWRSLGARKAATLAAGLRHYSRSYMAEAGTRADLTESLLAMVHDDLQAIAYMHAGKKARKPELISQKVIYGEKKKDNYMAFDNVEDFERALENLRNV